jgi:hypothetical protein
MAWGKKKQRELEYRKTGQAAALEPGDLGAREIYDEDDAEFAASWELEPNGSDDEAGLEPNSKLDVSTLAD